MRSWLRLGCSAAALYLFLTGAAQAEPLRIFYFIWVGYGPFFVAQEKGFFAKEGVAVELIHIRRSHRRLCGTVRRPGRRDHSRYPGRTDVF